jgi:hypothetical protein
MTYDASPSLSQFLALELTQPAPREALPLVSEIRQRHGTAVVAVLFYGSCLRTRKFEDEVLDFYVLVDSYRAAYSSRTFAWLNAALPPNVFYLEARDEQKTLRAKYAVISTADFQQAVTPRSVHAIVWGRFCQPFAPVYARDEAAHILVTQCAVQAALTFVSRIVPLLPASGDRQRFRSEDLWQRGFQETYGTELRPERPERIRQLYTVATDRYDQVASAALRELEHRGLLQVNHEGEWVSVAMPRQSRRRAVLSWKMRRPLAKALYAVRLLKSAATFGDWLPYVLWKLGRHTGKQIELTERQRRYPLVWGWPVIFRLLWRRDLR